MVVLYREVIDMLKMFQVENYKGFKNQLFWDLSHAIQKGAVRIELPPLNYTNVLI